jgi:hypothetical protein
MGDRELPIAMPSLLEELIVHLKNMWFSNIQQFHDGFDLQDKPFRQCVTVTKLISDYLYGFIDWYISEKANNIKVNEGIWRWKVYKLQQLYEVARILYEGFLFSGKRTQYLTEKTSQGIAWGTNRIHYRPQRKIAG